MERQDKEVLLPFIL